MWWGPQDERARRPTRTRWSWLVITIGLMTLLALVTGVSIIALHLLGSWLHMLHTDPPVPRPG